MIYLVRRSGPVTARMMKKILDKEVPYEQIPVGSREAYHKAECAEW